MTEVQPHVELGWPEIAAMIFAAQGITSGLWRLGVKIRFAAITMQMVEDGNDTNTVALPTSMSAMEAIAVFPAQQPGPMVFDAAKLLSLASRIDSSKARARSATVKVASTGMPVAKSVPKALTKTKPRATAK